MLKAPRFMKEYANFTKLNVMSTVAEKRDIVRTCDDIDAMLRQYERGLCSIGEIMARLVEINNAYNILSRIGR